MGLRRWACCLALLCGIALSGCYTTPVRHLAADVAMVQVGRSSEEDVLVFLGKPDATRELPGGELQYLYEDNRRTVFEKTPYLGKYIGSPSVQKVVVTFKNGVVSQIRFSESDADDMAWADDYPWQESEN